MALQGTLTDFGIGEIFQLIGQQQKTGILIIEEGPDDTARVEVHFLGGKILRCHAARRDRRNLLGAMLVNSEAVSKSQLNAALRQQKKTGKRIGETLVEMGVISKDDLDEFAELQTRETLYNLFEWKTGKYRFESKPATFAEVTERSIPAESILMEGFRMLDEWPLIRAEINNYEVVYKAIKSLEDAESEAEALERVLDDAFSEFLDDDSDFDDSPRKKGPTGAASNLGRSERRVFSLIDGKRDVYSLIGVSRLGEFETCKAALTLISEGYITPVRVKPPKETGRGFVGLPSRDVWGRVALNFIFISALVAGFFFMPRSKAQLDRDAETVARLALERLRANRVAAVAGALEIYQLERGAYPDRLEQLVDGGVLASEVLDVPGQTPLDYLSIGQDYDLR